jgi:hypothetical protein
MEEWTYRSSELYVNAWTAAWPYESPVPFGAWVGSRTGLDDVERRTILPITGLEL